MSDRLTDRVAEIVGAKLDELGRDDVHYEVTLQIAPGPQGPQPMLGILFTMPAVTLGQWTSTMGMVPDLYPPQEAIEGAVLQMLEGLRNNLQMERDAVRGQANGSGLIIPGRQ